MNASEGEGLPEVWEVVKGQSGVHEIGWSAGMPVCQEAGPHLLDIGDTTVFEFGVEPVLHDGRHIDGHNSGALGCHGCRELSRATTEFDNCGRRPDAEGLAECNLLFRSSIHLVVVAGDVLGVEVLPSS